MKIESYLQCVHCGKTYDIGELRYNCDCGGILDVKRDLSKVDGGALKALWEKRWGQKRGIESSGVWRYRELILDAPDDKIVTRQEGNTRLYPASSAGCRVLCRPAGQASGRDCPICISSMKAKTPPAVSKTAA